MKQAIKRLAHAVNDVLNENSIANEMNALFDGGEWSQCAPDFSQLVTRLGLTREVVMSYIDEAERLAKIHQERQPKIRGKMNQFDHWNFDPWTERAELLHCIFMSGELQPVHQ